MNIIERSIENDISIRKEVVFLPYKTSIWDCLESVWKVAEEDEIALLWRPHPLIRATMKSIRPQLWVEYNKLVKKYREEGWGIYDDTVDMDRAIVISDAYYGDGSSLVQLYQKTGKPIMIQNAEIVKVNQDLQEDLHYFCCRKFVR